jgi:predicted amino acid-binding ACT domain protein
MNSDFNELYDDWVDHINSQPLTTNRIDELSDVINVNQQIINRIYSIRRHLEMTDDETFDETFEEEYNIDNVFGNVFGNNFGNGFGNSIRNLNNLNTNYVDNSINHFANQGIEPLFNNTGLVGRSENMFGNGIVSRLFSILLEGDVNINDMEDVKVTLTNQQFDKLFSETVKENNKQNYESKCNICMDEYKLEDVVVKLGCKHVFHKDCIYNWLCNEKVTCPVCRKDTRDDLNGVS